MISQKKSPWLNYQYENLFLNELSFAENPYSLLFCNPLGFFKWIHRNKSKKLLFKSLSEFAPLFPVISYKGRISSWQSPPPSGSGNAVFIVLGRDQSNKLRSAGGNYFNSKAYGLEPKNNFWEEYDQCQSVYDKYKLISSTVNFYKALHDSVQIKEAERFATIACTMPVYILILDKNKFHMAVAPAIVSGCKPVDFSYEKLGEVTL